MQPAQLEKLGQPVHKAQRVQIPQCQAHKVQPVLLVQPVTQGQRDQPGQLDLRAQPGQMQASRRQYKTKLPITPSRQLTNLRLSVQLGQL